MNFERFGALVSRHWVLVLVGWVILAVGLHLVSPRWDDVTHDGDFAYLPDEMTSVRGEKLLEKAFPDNHTKSQVAMIVAREDGKLTPGDFAVMDRLVAAFPASDSADEPIASTWDYNTPVIGQKLLSGETDEGQAVLLVLNLRNEFMAIDNMALMRRIHETLAAEEGAENFPPGLKLGVSGSAAIGCDMLFSAEESINSTESATILLVVVILLLVYRAPGLVLVPLITIGISVYVASDVVASITQLSGYVDWIDFKIFSTTKIFVIVILFGAGTDYCLFLISRYEEELRGSLAPEEAMAKSLGNVGGALAASALTTIFGLGMMIFADFGKFSNSGPAIAMCLTVALAACVTFAPAMLRGLGRSAFWPFNPLPQKEGGSNAALADKQLVAPTSMPNPASSPRFSRFWEWMGGAITARPGLVLVVSLLIMLPITRPVRVLVGDLAAGRLPGTGPSLAVPVTYDLMSELRADCPSVRGANLMWRYFPADQASPVTVVAFDSQCDFNAKEGRSRIALLTKELCNFEITDAQGETVRPILSVRSLTEPMGDQPGSFSPLSQAGRRKLAALRNPRTIANFVSQTPQLKGKVTRLEMVFAYNPFSQESIHLLKNVEKLLQQKAADPASGWQGTNFEMVGTTSGIRDLETVVNSDNYRIQVLVVIAVLAIIIVILGRPFVCVYLVLSVLLGYYVTIGASELLFRWLYGDSYLGLDWKVPLFLFVILIAVGEDYNIYLVSRVNEEQKRRGPMKGLRAALLCTGGIITSCGLIMAGTFAAMITGTLRAMQELGFALALGVLLDTFVIRTILVPAFLAILARREERKAAGKNSDAGGSDETKDDDDSGCPISRHRRNESRGQSQLETSQQGS